jgi:hypothetical protein
MIEKDSSGPRNLTRFLIILSSFCLLDLLSLPIFLSYDLWVFADRSNFLNLDHLLANHLRLGVDAFYSYGLLPVLIQHVLFGWFGRGYWPLVGCTVVVVIFLALFWSLFVGYLSNRWSYLLAVVVMSPILLWINPNFPYSLVQLSMLFALLFLLKGRADIALALSVVGCFSVPSLPLLLTGLLGLYIIADWWCNTDRQIGVLGRRLTPGIVTCVVLLVVLSAFFGFRSTLVTALPILGVKFYYGSGKMDFTDLMKFILPAGHSFKYYVAYYIGSPAGWWILCTIALVILGAVSAIVMLRNRKPDPRNAAVLFCALLQAFFVIVAYRGDQQHVLYDPITAAGMFVAISIFPVVRWRNLVLALFVCIGVLGQALEARHTLWAWKNTHRSPLTANLYAEPEYAPEMANVLNLAATHKVLIVSHASGVYNYYPPTKPIDSWYVMPPLMSRMDEDRVIEDIKNADVVVEDTTHIAWFVERNPRAASVLHSMCLTEISHNFQIWWWHPPESAVCKPNPIPAYGGVPSAVR